MKKLKTIPIALLCILGYNTVQAQGRLDPYFDHLFKNKKFMGSVAISFKDSIIYSHSEGYIDTDSKTLIDQNSKFRVGSISKTFAATLVLKAMEEGRLKLTDPLAKWFPQFKNASQITIEQMLKHRSGIYNSSDIPEEAEWEQKYHTHDEVIAFVKDRPSNFKPGTKFEYSNTNYILLGFILEKIYKKDFATLLKEKITTPLGLKNTYYSFETDISKNEAYSYNIQDEYLINQKVNYSNHPASGGILSTPIELNKFISALFEGKILTQKSLELMLSKKKGQYGMGVKLLEAKSIDIYEHSGRVENYLSEYWYFPKEKLGLVSLSNAINIDISAIQNTLAQYSYGNTPKIPDFDQIEGLNKEEFSKVKGTYFDSDKSQSRTISSNGEYLIFQDSRVGEMYVPFAYKGKNIFEYSDIKLEFFPEKNELIIDQNNSKLTFKKL